MELNIGRLILDAGPVVKLVMLVLIVFSVVSWGIIVTKYKRLQESAKLNQSFLNFFWGGQSLESAYRKAGQLEQSPVASVFKSGYSEYKKFKEDALSHGSAAALDSIIDNTQRALDRSLSKELLDLESRLPFLATTGSATPFIGLFGTVWGIMNSFLSIGAKGSSNLAVVAPGISEALIATALGLFAAIPAVIAYNFFVSRIRGQNKEIQHFCSDFINALKRAQLGSGA